MSAASTVFVDTGVLLYADDGADEAKRLRARQWLDHLWRAHRGRISMQVLNEYYVSAVRRLGMAQGDARAKVRRLQLWQPWQLDHQTIETAWGVEARHGLPFCDALIVAAAMQAGCGHLLTEDLQHGQRVESLTILNPFLFSPDELPACPA
ncbi:PIN domain-containing protein [Pseudorhodoferax sp.]|uniref:PIN domain-containing protein n=1 Tax=Pseudorhodoferax sp. TaxID=1993553 RepID=UPI0039E57A20